MDKKKLVVCTVFENEAAYLPEWLAYHRLVGVDHFVLYDNGSADDPSRAILNSPLAEHVTLLRWPQRPGQLAAYRHFIDIFGPGFEWVAFLDVDEFLLPLSTRSVVDTLESLSHAAAVLVHRLVFGPGTWQAPPPGLVIENYDRRAPDDFPANRHVKTIARCSELLDVTPNPHEFRVSGPVFNTAGDLAPNSAIQAQPCYRNLVINHYYTRSRRDWLAKLQRSDAAADATMPKDEPGLFDHLAEVCQVRDTTIQAFAASVRGVLGFAAAAAPPREAASPGPVIQEPAAPMFPVGPGSPIEPLPMAEPMSPAGPAGPVSLAGPAGPVSPAGPAGPVSPAAPAGPVSPAGPAGPVSPAVEPMPMAAASTVAQMPPAARPEPPPQPDAAVSGPVAAAPGWVARGADAQERAGGLGLVFRDRSRAGEHWLAALRGAAVAAIDPAFLLDEYERIREFPTAAEARAACDAALAQRPGH